MQSLHDEQEQGLLEVLQNHGGWATWSDFEAPVKSGEMSRRTLSKKLKRLIELGVLKKCRERANGRETWVYRFASEEVSRIFDKMDGQLQAIAEELYKFNSRAESDPAERVRALVPFVDELLLYHRALTLMACRLAAQAPDEETFARRFVKLMSWFDDMSAGRVAAALRLNSDVAEDVTDVVIGSLPPQVMELVSGREG